MKQLIQTSLWILLGIIFLFAGGSKLWDPTAHAEEFAHWGYPLWFVYVTGTIEVLGGIGLFVPAGRLYGVLLLSLTMIGASVTHLRAGEMGAFPVPVVLLLALLTLAWTMRYPKRTP
ncbi:MAG: hypothetical protein NPIRA02_37590 [Nitrospirales bacterium]|nr:MAG: hypothetical protein NPIRA02_37590 [Nitrospirales bacterium]